MKPSQPLRVSPSASPRRAGPAPVFSYLLACVWVGASGCAHEAAPSASTTPSSSAQAEREGTEPGSAGPAADSDESPEGAAEASTEGPGEPVAAGTPADSTDQAAAEPPLAEDPAVAGTPEPPVVVDMTPAAAPAICAGLVDEPEGVRRCAFARGGLSLPNGARADVLELEYDTVEYGPVVAAYLVVRIPMEEYPTTQLLGERTDVPGMSTQYTLGRLERTTNGVRIRVTQTQTIYPNTGDPDAPSRPEVERTRGVVTCSLDAETQYYDCERG